jgi:chromosome segregation ATPase
VVISFLSADVVQTESPFRLLDEYDVFMDEARRADTLLAIQQHALRPDQFGRQMIIITPNSLQSVKTTNHVRVFRMPDPNKVSAHGLQQQTLD